MVCFGLVGVLGFLLWGFLVFFCFKISSVQSAGMDILLEKNLKVQGPKHDAVLRLETSHTLLMQTVIAVAGAGCEDCSTRQENLQGLQRPSANGLAL